MRDGWSGNLVFPLLLAAINRVPSTGLPCRRAGGRDAVFAGVTALQISHNEYEQLLKFFCFSVLLKTVHLKGKKQIWELINLKTFKVI